MPDLLLEVGCEELPSTACREIVDQVPELVQRALAAAGCATAEPTVAVAPRRFAVRVGDLPERLESEARAVRGPAVEAAFSPDGAPTRAAEGFARAQGVAIEDLVVREGQGGRRFVFAERPEAPREVAEVVPDVAARVLDGLRFSKTMRWGDGQFRFSRPVRWIVAKLDGETVPFELHGLRAGEVSQGHRFLGGPARIGSPASYEEDLRAVAVMPDHRARRATIVAGLDRAAAALGGSWRDPAGKLEEVVFLVEWPSVLTGRIADEHLALPGRVLVTAMQSHQRYFPVEGDEGRLLPRFLAVQNGDPAHADLITRGNEDVLDARLQDAAFSFARDRQAGLAALDARLDAIVFHQRLGSMAAKRDRLVDGVSRIAERVGVDPEAPEAAARLAKADQGAVLVAEFPELEGHVAAEYARLEGRPEAVARALDEQYLPEGPDSPAPSTEAGAVLAAAEKIDNIVGAFAVDEAPTGSRDPYGIRRAGAGLARIVLERDWDVDVGRLLREAYERYRAQGADLALEEAATLRAADGFLAERLTFALGTEGVGAEAVAAARTMWADGPMSLVAAARWARAIEAARGSPDFEAAWTAQTRCQKLADRGPADAPEEHVSAGDPGEDALAAALHRARPGIEAAREARDFAAGLAAADELPPALDRFFQDVLVNTDDVEARARRYGLVRGAAATLRRVADFSRITQPGGAE